MHRAITRRSYRLIAAVMCGSSGRQARGRPPYYTTSCDSDLRGGRGFCFLDPHGDACKAIAAATPRVRTADVIYFDPSDPDHAIAYNPLDGVAKDERATRAANIVSAFKAIWGASWGPRLEYVLTNALRLLLDNKDQSLIGLPRLFLDERFRLAAAQELRRSRDPLLLAARIPVARRPPARRDALADTE